MNVWKCYSCQKRFNGSDPGRQCPFCKRLTQWILISVLPAGDSKGAGERGAGGAEEMQDMQAMRGRYELKNVLYIKGSDRPCRLDTCTGKMYAYLSFFNDGGFRLVFTCDRCHKDYAPGLGTAITSTSEPPALETALV